MGFNFEITKAKRENVFVKMGLTSPPSGGKSYSSLILAKGMCKEMGVGMDGSVLYIGTEGDRDKLYSDEFDYDHIGLPDHTESTPEMFAEALNYGVDKGYKVIIIDSATTEWEAVKRIHDSIPGNSFAAWGKVKPRHKKFVDAVLKAKAHVILCYRSKQKHEQSRNENGKLEIKNVGLGIQGDSDISYMLMVCLDLDQETHVVTGTSKDNTHIFEGRYEKIKEKDGVDLVKWANKGDKPTEKPKVVETTPTLKEKSPKVHDAFQKLPPEATEKALKDAGLNVIDDLVSKTRDEALAIYAAAQGYAKEGGGSE